MKPHLIMRSPASYTESSIHYSTWQNSLPAARFINLCDAMYHNQAIEFRASPLTLRVTLQAKMNQRGVATLDSYG
jgi:hypothetical protein